MNNRVRPRPTWWTLLAPPLAALASLSSASAQTAAPPSSAEATDEPRIPAERVQAPPRAEDDSVLLTPFQVDATKDQGYYAQNTLAGSRLNSNLFDLAASITVVTKQQMDDTASTDINDVFRYEANTEGSATYTPQILNRNFVKDSIAGYSEGAGDSQTNATSNRVRGLGVPTNSLNYYQANPRIPFDSYNTQSVEISRGPNSLLFGVGSPAGIVNQTSAQAALNRNTNTVTASFGSYDSVRGSLAVNRSLIEDKLAVYAAVLYDDKQFARKPSYDETNRQYATLTFKPFKKTVIRGSFERYDNENRRPNFIAPRDNVTPWLQAGRPSWNPVTRTITLQDSGVTRPGTYVTSTGSRFYTAGYNTGDAALQSMVLGTTTNPNPQYTAGIFFNDNSRPVWRIDNGTEIDFFQKQPQGVVPFFVVPPLVQNTVAPALPTQAQINADATWSAVSERRWTSSGGPTTPTFTQNGVTYTQSTWSAPGVTNKAIYDWDSINLNQANSGQSLGKTYNLELEQQITEDLFFSGGWFRQDFNSADTYTISQQQGLTLLVDTNTHLINGQPNPYFGLPYVEDFQPDTAIVEQRNDNYRAVLAYKLDFTDKQSAFVRWLGRHQLMGMWSLQESDRRQERKRLHYTSGDADATLRYLPNRNDNSVSGPTGWNYQGSGIRRNYYVASPGDPQATVTHGTGEWGNAGYGGPTSGSIEVYDWNTRSFKDVSVGLETITRSETTMRSQSDLESFNVGLQSFLLGERLVTTVGWRRDEARSRNTTDGVIFKQEPDATTGRLVQDQGAWTNQQRWVNGIFQTDPLFNRWQRWDETSGETSTRGFVARPLKGWRFIEGPASHGNWVAEALSTLSFTYNESDNFNPPSTSQVDPSGNYLPKPTGEGKDYGVRIAMFNNKLVAGFNIYENTNMDERTGTAGLILSRLTGQLDTNIFRGWAETVVRIRSGEDPTAESGFAAQPLTPAQEAQVGELWGLPYNYYRDLPAGLGATQDVTAEGYEAQLTYNPTRNWTMKATFAKQESVYNSVAPQYDEWLAVRLPKMLAATSTIADYSTFGGTPIRLSSFWNGYGFQADVRLSNANTNGNTSPERYYENIVNSQYALAKSQEGVAAPNQRKYRGSFLTNYNFSNGRLRGFAVGGAFRWEDKAAMGYYGRAADPLSPTILNAPDPNRPIFDKGNEFVDAWVSYRRKIFNDKIGLKVQLNVSNVLEDGRLQPIAVNYDGSTYGYRIVDPREWRVTTTFEF